MTEGRFLVKLPEIFAETAAALWGGAPLTGPQVPVLIKHVCFRREKPQDGTPLAVQWRGLCFHRGGHGFDPWLGNQGPSAQQSLVSDRAEQNSV